MKHRRVPTLAMIIVALLFGLFPTGATAAGRTIPPDLNPKSALYPDTVAALSYGLMNGRQDGRFYPNDAMSIGATFRVAANIRLRVGGYPSVAAEDDLSIAAGIRDVEAAARAYGKWTERLTALASNPGKPATRGEAAEILDAIVAPESVAPGNTSFPDVSANLATKINAVNGGPDRVVIGGFTDGRFGPDEGLTRAQFAAMAGRFARLRVLAIVAADITSGRYSSNQFKAYKNDPSSAAGLLLTALNNGWEFYSSNPLTGADEDDGISSLVREHPYAMSLSLSRGTSLPWEFLTVWLEPDGSFVIYSYEKYTVNAAQADDVLVRQSSDFDGVYGLVRTAAPTAVTNRSGGASADTDTPHDNLNSSSRPVPSGNGGNSGSGSNSSSSSGTTSGTSGSSGTSSNSRSDNGGSVATSGTSPAQDGAPIGRNTSGLGGIDPGDNDNSGAGDWFDPTGVL